MPQPALSKPRLAYIDWMRGLACVLMFQTHCYDSWLGGTARQTRFLMYSQLLGTFPAPLFLFLAGISFALVTEKLRQKELPPSQIARTTILRGAEIFGYGLLFRIQEYVIAWGWAPKSDLLRVDILNTIGLSMMLMGVMCWLVLSLSSKKMRKQPPSGSEKPAMWGQPPPAVQPGEARLQTFTKGAPSRARSVRQGWASLLLTPLVVTAAATALLISLLTPLLWTTWRPRFLPWPLESYINGVHNFGTPQAWLFPIFPWTAFAVSGLAVGFLLQSQATRVREATVFFSLGGAGIVVVELARWLDARPVQLYPVYDFWHTSPNFFLIRVGMLLMILTASYAWCRWGLGQWGFSPLILLGQASLLVYWVHIEFVYGRFSILTKRNVGIGAASAGLLTITLAMLALAFLRTHSKDWMKNRKPQLQPKLS